MGIVVTICVAFIGGKIVGIIIGLLGKKEIPYIDEDEFFLEEEKINIARVLKS